MFNALLSKLHDVAGNDRYGGRNKRAHERRKRDRCVSMIGDKIFPVIDWSFGGLLVYADAREFALNDEIDVTMKFKTRDNIVAFPHRARVIRKTNDNVAFQFLPLPQELREGFQGIISAA